VERVSMNSFNKFHKVLKPIALSNTRFYEKILGKYRKNKMINSGSSILFLYKGGKHESSQKLNFSIYWLLDLRNSYSSVLRRLGKMVRNSTGTGTQTLMLQPGKTVIDLKVLQMEDTKRIQDKGIGKCKGKHFSVRDNSFDEKSTGSASSDPRINDKIGTRVEESFLLKKSTSISFSIPFFFSYFQMGALGLLNTNKFLGTNERNSIKMSVMLKAVSKVWDGSRGRKEFTAFERVVPLVESAISSAKKVFISVEKIIPAMGETEGPIVGSPLPMLNIPQDTIGFVFKAAVPYIPSVLRTETDGVGVKSVKNLPKSELLLKKMKLFTAKEVFSKKIIRDRYIINSNLPLLKVYPVLENHYKSDYDPAKGFTLSEAYPLLSGKKELFTPTAENTLSEVYPLLSEKNKLFNPIAENLYFLNQWEISQELQKIKETISDMEKSVSDKLISASFPEKESTKSNQEISVISEYVYQNIERRIRVEREMRGL